ncbi:hypothetical protein AAFF_G00163960 [Aldrovandia affinis]|uniref:Uncharacterized protein n=1 Tax=Aldrovandia affinis TaxID=143900 RepID=A0AAD7T039_9TELE|nr:hypothetical protein AAFF_G00163960 [Aldrovandia affinis]
MDVYRDPKAQNMTWTLTGRFTTPGPDGSPSRPEAALLCRAVYSPRKECELAGPRCFSSRPLTALRSFSELAFISGDPNSRRKSRGRQYISPTSRDKPRIPPPLLLLRPWALSFTVPCA